MKTRKIELWIGTLATFLFSIGLFYAFWIEPARVEAAAVDVLTQQVDDAMSLYAVNCAVCHGAAGEGIGATPPLANDVLRTADPENLQKIISRGLYNTAMPAWSLEDGGPLSEYQVDELVKMILFVNWEAVQNRVVDLGVAPLIPFVADPDPAVMEALLAADPDSPLPLGIQVYAETCVACHGADGAGTAIAPPLNTPELRALSADQVTLTVINGVPGTLMAGWEGSLTTEELSGVVNLILNWDQVPTGAIPEPEHAILVTESSLAMGEQLYSTTCALCHGPEGQGTQRAPSLNVKGYLGATSDLALEQIITLGVPGTAMPAWGDRLTEAEIQAVVGFIRAWEPNAPEVAQPTQGGGGPWWQTNPDAAPGPTQNKGGPRWRQQGMTTPPGQQNSTTSGPTPAAGGQQNSADQQYSTTAGTEVTTIPTSPADPPTAAATHIPSTAAGQGTPPEWAGTGQGNVDTSQAGSTQGQHTTGQGSSRWTQPAATNWWEVLDSRAWTLLGSLLAGGLGFLVVGMVGVIRLKQP